MGDCLWYLADIATTLEVDLSTVAAANIGKLVRRYPDGFSPERSINRDDGPASLNELTNEHIYTPPSEGLQRDEKKFVKERRWTPEQIRDASAEGRSYTANDAGEWVIV